MRKKVLSVILLLVIFASVGLTVSIYAKWITGARGRSNPTEDATYQVHLVNGDTTTNYSLLEIDSMFNLPLYEDDLTNEKFFLGWALTSSETSNFISYGDYQLSTYKSSMVDNVLTMYAIWTTSIPTGKTLISVSYPTNQSLKLLVDSSKTFYLFNVNVPGKIGSQFLSYFTSTNAYDYTKYSGTDSNGTRFELNDYFKSSSLTANSRITLTAVYE